MSGRARVELALITLVALAVRVALVLGTPHYVPATDAGDFDRNALSLALTGHFPVASLLTLQGGPTAFRPPAFSVLLALAYRVAGPMHAHARWEAGRLMEAVLGTVTVLLIWGLARRTFGARVATVAGTIAAVYPPLILVGSSLLSESLLIPLELAAVLSALEARGEMTDGPTPAGLGLCLLAGVLSAAAALARSNGIVIVIALAAMVWLPHAGVRPGVRAPAGARARGRVRSLLAPAVLVASVALALVPWTLRNKQAFHSFVPTSTETGYALAGVYNPSVQSGAGRYPGFWYPPTAAMLAIQHRDPTINEAQLSRRLTHESLEYIVKHPVSVLRESAWSLPRLLSLGGIGFTRWIAQLEAYPPTLAIISIYSFWLVGLVAIAGIIVLARRRHNGHARGPGFAFWLCPALLLVSTLPVIGDARYRSPCDPFILLLSAVAVVELWPRRAPLGAPSQ